MHVQIALYNGLDPLDVLGPFEVIHSAGLLSGGQVTTEFVTDERAREVPSGFASITLTATAVLDPGNESAIVVPGAAGGLSMDPAVENGIGWLLAAAGRSELPNRPREALTGPDAAVATVCGGSILLASGGLADGSPLVTHERGRDLAGDEGGSGRGQDGR
ncbi:hypothetical protein [Amycolatopsis sp. CA-126428]|uniref:hypothetical protein n=1 Tax=Amycolatopsis sp. CA-126428 TaxID=2073158 RepID=UPI001E3652F6|nr:hypothetical protein [Amycolatopsis sp. CA-126428]